MEKKLAFKEYEIRVFSLSENAQICRIGKSGDQPDKVTDAFYPAQDLGYLWFRWVDNHLACSGILSVDCVNEDQLNELVDFIGREVLQSNFQIDYQIDFVQRLKTVIESGEESLRF